MGLRPLYFFNPFSAGIVFRRQILTSKDDPRTERVKSSPTMWWRLIVSVLSIVIIILLQQFDDVNALQSPIFIRCSQLFLNPGNS